MSPVVQIVTRSDIERCPIKAMHAGHYRRDGTCKCRTLWRWECSCGKHGRFYRDAAVAQQHGSQHWSKSRGEHRVILADNRGRKHGPV